MTVTRRNFLKFLGVGFAAAALPLDQIKFVADKFTDEQAVEVMTHEFDVKTFQQLLNDYLPAQMFKDALYEPNPFLAMIEKDSEWKGGYIEIPMIYGKTKRN